MITRTRRGLALGVAAMATAGLSACGGSDNDSTAGAAASTAPSISAAPAASMVGPGCADYTKANPTGAGSVAGMAQAPVTTAASNNPLLKTLVSAVSGKLNPKVNLVDTLNGGQFTVFAPTDEAFGAVPAATLKRLSTDSDLLTKVLTYHVLPGQLSPDQVDGMHNTVEGASLKVTGSGDAIKVNDANVLCGGVKTANATVYLIDSVLMPK